MVEIKIFYEGEIVKKKQAIESGHKVYFTGKPCKHGHLAQRRTASGNCVPCSKILVANAHAKNPESVKRKSEKQKSKPDYKKKMRERAIKYNLKPEIKQKMIEYRANYYINNKEKIIIANRKWNEINSENVKCQRHNRRLVIRSSKNFTAKEFKKLVKYQDYICVYCSCDLTEKNLSRDHIIPVSRGGNNLIENIQALCRSCNQKKHAKTHEEYLLILGNKY